MSIRGLIQRCQSAIVGRGSAQEQAPRRGEAAERLAEAHLARAGLQTLARNVRCRGGEVDLICRDGTAIVFVEVRLRGRSDFGSAAESITRRKQARIILAAQHWLAGAGSQHQNAPCRFDAVLLDALDPSALTWLRGAFES